MVLVVDKGGHPACQEEDLGGNVLENPLGDVPLSQFQRHDLVGKKTKGKDNRCIVVPMAHPVLFSLVWVLDNKKKCYEVECLRPVVHEHSQQFHVNFRPEESKEWILFPHASPFQSCRRDEEKVCIPEEKVKNNHERKEAEENQGVWDEDDVEQGLVLPEERSLNTVPKQLLPDELLVKQITFSG